MVTNLQTNQPLINIRLKGLDPEGTYILTDESDRYMVHIPLYGDARPDKNTFRGDALMNAGYTFPMVFGDYPAMQLHFRKVN